MKTTITRVFFILLIFTQISIHSQNLEQLTCEQKYEMAEKLVPIIGSMSLQEKNQVLSLIGSCSENTGVKSYVKGMFLMETSTSENQRKTAMQKFLDASGMGHENAGLIFAAYTINNATPRLPFDIRTSKNFLNSAPDNNPLANFLLGYMAMKGIGEDINIADYSKALNYYTKSNSPMAIHYLGLMHYFGYGVSQNKALGLQLLKNNRILNSQTLHSHLSSINPVFKSLTSGESSIFIQYDNKKNIPYTVANNEINGKYEGTLIKYDWSGTKILTKTPFTIDFNINYNVSGTERPLTYVFKGNGETISGTGRLIKDDFVLDGLNFNVDNYYKNHPDKSKINFKLRTIADVRLIPGFTSSKNSYAAILRASGRTDIREDEVHVKLILKKIQNTSSQSFFSANSNPDFARVYPNPIKKNFTLTFQVPDNAEVKINIFNQFYQSVYENSLTYEGSGTKSVDVTNVNWLKGYYTIQFTVNGSMYTQKVLKQ